MHRGRFSHAPGPDGVRALAVAAVLAYHLGTTGGPVTLPGGFLGVDVFFVLSGFLITTLLLGEHARRGRIRLGAFYARRARRLLPALYVLLAVLAMVAADLLRAAAAGDPAHVFTVDPPARFCTDAAVAANRSYRWDGVHYYKPGALLYCRTVVPQRLASAAGRWDAPDAP